MVYGSMENVRASSRLDLVDDEDDDFHRENRTQPNHSTLTKFQKIGSSFDVGCNNKQAASKQTKPTERSTNLNRPSISTENARKRDFSNEREEEMMRESTFVTISNANLSLYERPNDIETSETLI
jgi:hypothetical protein